MAKVTYEYQGNQRPEMKGTKKSFDTKDLTDKKLARLEEKGWTKVASKPKAKPKAKPKKKGSK